MDDLRTASICCPDPVLHEYARAFAELERQAARGLLTLAQLRRDVHALRERHTGGLPVALCMPRQHR